MPYTQSFYNVDLDSSNILQDIEVVKNELQYQQKLQELPLINYLYNDQDLESIENLALEIRNNFKNLVIIGIGGSSLSSKALIDLNIFNTDINIYFLENIDYIVIERFYKNLDFLNTAFLVISKSGQTYETIALFNVAITKIKQKHNDFDFSRHFFIITEPKKNVVRDIATSIEANILDHKNIGGRFSAFTNVGLLAAKIAGLDIREIKKGAKLIVDEFFVNGKNSQTALGALAILNNTNIENLVMMPYSDRLGGFNQLHRQIWAESTGKNGFGITPVPAVGTIDQHSQLQLYLDGPKNKLFTVITINNNYDNNIISLPGNILDGKSLSDLLKAEHDATLSSLIEAKCLVRLINLDKLAEKELGSLIMNFMLETIIVAKTLDINPFDQPAVEKNKVLIEKKLI